jgi:hypothetical protein
MPSREETLGLAAGIALALLMVYFRMRGASLRKAWIRRIGPAHAKLAMGGMDYSGIVRRKKASGQDGLRVKEKRNQIRVASGRT